MNTKDEQLEEDKEEAVIFGMSLPGGYISSQGNQAKEMLEAKRLLNVIENNPEIDQAQEEINDLL